MKTKKVLSVVIACVMLFLSGVPQYSFAISRKLKRANARIAKLESDNAALAAQRNTCRDTVTTYGFTIRSMQNQNDQLQQQLKDQKASNEQVLNHLKDLSVISGSQAESINKFLETMGVKDAYIKDLQAAIARKDSITLALALNLKSAIGNLDDKDINIKIDKGVIYVDISDKMLFKTGKYEVAGRAKEVLGKVAKVLLAHPEIEFMVEGHTDNVPYREGVLLDNWDLSVKRATSVVRILQDEYSIPPARMTAAGRGEYVPVMSNDLDEGRAANRRTRIVILPMLDQFFKLLEKPTAKNP